MDELSNIQLTFDVSVAIGAADLELIDRTICDGECLTSCIHQDTIVEGCSQINIQSVVQCCGIINIQSAVESYSTISIQGTVNVSVTIVRVNSESIDAVTISDFEHMVSTIYKQITINRGVVTNVKGPTNKGST